MAVRKSQTAEKIQGGGEDRVKHVGFVEAVEGDTVQTVEGNTNKAGSREGGGVYRLERRLLSVYRFVFYG